MLPKVAVLFDNLGPYHIARLKACAEVVDLLVIENRRVSSEYAWGPSDEAPFRRITLDEDGRSGDPAHQKLRGALEACGPDAVAVPGWASSLAFNVIRWCSENNVPLIMMADSQRSDLRRIFWKEAIKRRVLKFCHAALVGGWPHRDYIMHLGMADKSIFLGYDVVDNQYFSSRRNHIRNDSVARRREFDLPPRYFLCSARFIPKKNLVALLHAFWLFREHYKATDSSADEWRLVILGDGELRPEIEENINALNLNAHVILPGFRQIDELPAFYSLATAFILPSTTEQWGLVVNEAMASGLPVLVSERCGCAPDLVENGRNGFSFDPFDVTQMADRMLLLARMEAPEREAMGKASQEIIQRWSPETFAIGLERAVKAAMNAPPRRPALLDRLLLRALAHR
jgi:glycosyltransferase involved in cell wall biosynthesis